MDYGSNWVFVSRFRDQCVRAWFFKLSRSQAGISYTLAPHCVPWHRPPGQVWCSAGVEPLRARYSFKQPSAGSARLRSTSYPEGISSL